MSEITSQQLVVFSLGAEEYALPIAAVHEIIRFTEPRSVASEAAWVRGVIGLRGKIIPVFDLAAAASGLMRRMLADALGRQGFDVVGTAADGDEALDLCREHRPDALTLDLHMPGLDGLGVLRALREGKAEPVPVVVVSAFSP